MKFTMSHALEFDVEQVFPFVRGLVPALARSSDMVGIGLRRNGALVAGAIFERYNGRNVWAHVAGHCAGGLPRYKIAQQQNQTDRPGPTTSGALSGFARFKFHSNQSKPRLNRRGFLHLGFHEKLSQNRRRH